MNSTTRQKGADVEPGEDPVDPADYERYKRDPPHRLRRAAFCNHISTAEGLLREYWKPKQSTRWLNQVDAFGWAAIHYAAFQGNFEICKLLITAGADANHCTERGRETPLFLAAATNAHKIVEYLIQNDADPNLSDITGKIPLEVSYGKSHKILREERLKHGKLRRLIPTIRKLLASKFMQLLLQLVLCIFLELFQEKLMGVLQKALQLIALLGPGVRQFIAGVFDRMLAPIFYPLFMYISPLLMWLVSPLLIFLDTLFHGFSAVIWSFTASLFASLGSAILNLLSPFTTILSLFIMPFWNLGMTVIRVLFQVLGGVLYNFFSVGKFFAPLFSRLVAPIRVLAHLFWISFKSSMAYMQIVRFFTTMSDKSWRIILFSLQPKQLAAKLVSPIILGASKLLYILPSSWIDGIALMYTRLAGQKRHVSDEEVAAATLFLAGLGIYIVGILMGGYITRIVLYIMYHFDWYDSELHSLSNIFVVFRDTNYTTLQWKPDGALHELGLLFTMFALPLLVIGRIVLFIGWWIFRLIFRRKQWKEVKKLRKIHEEKILREEREAEQMRTVHPKHLHLRKRKHLSASKVDRTYSLPSVGLKYEDLNKSI